MWTRAMTKEINSHMECGTWEIEKRPRTQKVVGSKWVFSLPRNSDGTIKKYKARFVARGFSQTKGVDYKEIWSPVINMKSIRTILAMAAAQDLDLYQDDVGTAYLNATMEEDVNVYMEQPKGFANGRGVCKLRRAIYGLKQSGRLWNKTLHTNLKSMGFRQLEADPCVYLWQQGEQTMVVGVYVDDLIIANNTTEQMNRLKTLLNSKYRMPGMEELHWILGMRVKRERQTKQIWVDQDLYTREILKEFGMDESRAVATTATSVTQRHMPRWETTSPRAREQTGAHRQDTGARWVN
jgi:hypothetical protein